MNLISRKQFVALALILISALVVFLAYKQSRVNASQGTVAPGSLEALAQDSAANGIQSIDINTMLWEYEGIGGIDEALSKYSVIVAHPVSGTGYIWSSELQIIGTIGANGILTPVISISSALAEDISLRYGNSLTALRAALGGSAPTPTPTPTPCTASNTLISRCSSNARQSQAP